MDPRAHYGEIVVGNQSLTAGSRLLEEPIAQQLHVLPPSLSPILDPLLSVKCTACNFHRSPGIKYIATLDVIVILPLLSKDFSVPLSHTWERNQRWERLYGQDDRFSVGR